jgi:hypothetical protein
MKIFMKNIAMLALMLNLGVAGIYAQQHEVKMTFSGNGAPNAIDLKHPGANTAEENVAGSVRWAHSPFEISGLPRLLRSRPAVARASSFPSVAGGGSISLPGRESVKGRITGEAIASIWCRGWPPVL